jgi:hypothetical protein
MSSLGYLFVILLVLALVAFAEWMYVRSRSSQRESERRPSAERFDTTLGEFRDMREALRPLAGVTARKTSPSQRSGGTSSGALDSANR